jgi:hypothetical protein
MNRWWPKKAICLWAIALAATIICGIAPAEDFLPDSAIVHQHADEAFQRLEKHGQRSRQAPTTQSNLSASSPTSAPSGKSEDPTERDVLIGHGQGDLSKGKLVCQRVSELAARADLAKQIRVLVKEHATDRVRERTGREPEQDIEVVREELVQEYLQGVKIVDRRVDEDHNTCSATAVMPAHPTFATPLREPEPATITTR